MHRPGWRVVLPAIVTLALALGVIGLVTGPFVHAQAQPLHLPLETLTQSTPITLDVPILLYHHVDGDRTRYNMPVKDFAAQMEYLSKNSYTAVSIDQVAAALRGQGELPSCPVAITFDDAYRSAYDNALSILQQHGLRATFYVPVEYIGRSSKYLTWDQVRDLIGKGMWIGSHSLSHPFLARLSRLSAQRQITESKAILEAQLGIPITTFAYPYGSFSQSAKRAVEVAGYVAAVWTGLGVRQTSDRLYQLRRVGVYYPMRLTTFAARLRGSRPPGAGPCLPGS